MSAQEYRVAVEMVRDEKFVDVIEETEARKVLVKIRDDKAGIRWCSLQTLIEQADELAAIQRFLTRRRKVTP